MRRLTIVSLTALALVAGACGGTSNNGSSFEGEDCDAEDFANREDDCGFSESDRKKHKKKVTVKKKRDGGYKVSRKRR